MAARTAIRNVIVGLLFLGSLAVLGAASLLISTVSVFTQREALAIRFPSVDNLEPGDDVVYHGMRVGQVDSIRYRPDESLEKPVLVRCTVLKEVADRITDKTQIEIGSKGPLGGRQIEIMPPAEPGPDARRLDEYSGEAPGDLFRRLEKLVERNEENISEAIAEIKNTIPEIKSTFQAINSAEGTVGALIKDSELRDKVKKALSDLADSVSNETGTIGYLLRNEEAKQKVESAITDIQKVARQLSEGEGVAGALINDKKLADRVNEAVDDIHEIVHKINTGQGTIGQAVNNPKAWEELVKALVLARETIEDLREQAPIATFVDAVFTAF
jgi:phospholipid/cholesterol/gamma-HCH transport system substrate-binding protein